MQTVCHADKYNPDKYLPPSEGYPPSGGGRRRPGDFRHPHYHDRYPDGRYPPDDGTHGGERYGDRERYGGDDRYYTRYGGGSRYGTRFGDKHGGDRYPPPPVNKYPGGHGYGYYGDEKRGGSRWFFRPDRRPGGRPHDERPPPVEPARPPYDPGYRRPVSPGPDGPIYDSFGGVGPGRPYSTRCDEGDGFKQAASRQRMRKEYIRRFLKAATLDQCQRECAESRDFVCRSFNFR